MAQTGAVGPNSSDRTRFVSDQSRESSIENFAKDFQDNTLECDITVVNRLSRVCGVGFQDGVD